MLGPKSPKRLLVNFTTTLRWIHSSIPLSNDVNVAREWLDNLSPQSLPSRSFHVRYDRASGPGGQKVNKVSSKCTLTLERFSSCSLFPQEVRRQVMDKRMWLYNPVSDSIVVQSDETRSREQNRQLCLAKLVDLIKETCYFPKEADPADVEKWERVRGASKKRRLKSKKLNGERKRTRKQLW